LRGESSLTVQTYDYIFMMGVERSWFWGGDSLSNSKLSPLIMKSLIPLI